MFDSISRSGLTVFVLFIYLCLTVQSQVNADRNKKQAEELEETREKQREENLNKVYSTSKAHEFLNYDKCLQRMKCPNSRKEECSEECRAGNTEEEIEEHEELTRDEGRSTFKRAPKRKYEIDEKPTKKEKTEL